MRVLIELLDKSPIENVLGACIFEPEIVVYLCDKRNFTLSKESAVYSLFRRRKLKTKPRFYYFDAQSPPEIRRVLAAVVRDYPGCVFDFSGGSDLVLLQAGAYCLPLGVPACYINAAEGQFVNVQHCRHLAESFAMPTFTIGDVFALAGAAVMGSGHFDNNEEETPGFEEDALFVWKMVQQGPRAWGSFVAYLQAACAGTPLTALNIRALSSLGRGRQASKANSSIFEKLYKAGLLTYYSRRGGQVEFAFKSPLHKKCLLNQGIWLELYCYITARRSGLFDDVKTSVVIDWAGAAAGPDSTKNEVDVVLVKGIVPVFVSCKMSLPTPLALSEIRLLSSKFGGELSRAVVVTADTLGTENKALGARAADLDILLLDGSTLQSGQLAEKLQGAVLKNRTNG